MSTKSCISGFNEIISKNPKIVSVFGYKVSEVLVLTDDDKVYASGENEFGFLGFSHNKQVTEPTIVEELCDKNIIKFANGLYYALALTKDGKIYSWGTNNFGRLGNGFRDFCYSGSKPEMNKNLSQEMITEICCGFAHSIALTKNGEVLTWGYNGDGEIGIGSNELFQLTPIKLKGFDEEKIVAIACGAYHSIALTESAQVFSWGSNIWGQLGLEGSGASSKFRPDYYTEPKLVNFSYCNKKTVLFHKICCGLRHSMLLSRDGDVFTFGNNEFGQIGNDSNTNQMSPQKLISTLKFIDIASHFRYDISVALSSDYKYYIWGKCGEEVLFVPKKSKFVSLDQIFLNYHQITYKAVQISCNANKRLKLGNDCIHDENSLIGKSNYENICLITS